jgi:excisionase family DNA binding protein
MSTLLVTLTVDDFKDILEKHLKVNNSGPSPSTFVLPEKLMTQKELCNYLSISEPTLIALRKRKVIPFLKLGSSIRYDIAKVLSCLEKNKK